MGFIKDFFNRNKNKNNKTNVNVEVEPFKAAAPTPAPKKYVDADKILDYLFNDFGMVEEELAERNIDEDYTLYWDGTNRNDVSCSLEYPDGHEEEYDLTEEFKKVADKDYEGQFDAIKEYVEDTLIPKMMSDIERYQERHTPTQPVETVEERSNTEEIVFAPQNTEYDNDDLEEDEEYDEDEEDYDDDEEEEYEDDKEEEEEFTLAPNRTSRTSIHISERNRNGKISYYAQVNGRQVERSKRENLEAYINEQGFDIEM